MAQADIEGTALWKDVQHVIKSGPKVVQGDRKLVIHTEKEDFPIIKLKIWEERCDYLGNTGTITNIEFDVGAGDYVYRLFPFRENMEVSVKTIPQTESGGDAIEQDIDVVKYKAVLKPDMNPQPTGSRIAQMSYSDLNVSGMVTVKLELQDRNWEALRLKTFPGGTIRGKTVKDTIYSVLMRESRNILVDGRPPIDGINIIEPDNTKPIPNLLLEPGLKISLIPTFLQNESMGVYSTGLGTYFQRYNKKYYWFVYNLYDISRFDNDTDRAVFFAVPKEKLPGINRTYRKDGKVVSIVVTGDRSYIDNGTISDLNQGVGFRMADANAMMKKPVEITAQGPKSDRGRQNTEVATRDRPDGNIFAPVVGDSANPFKYYSSTMASNLARVDVVWENSDPDLIYPGMPCKYVFMDKDEYCERQGIIIGKYTVTELIGKAPVSSTYRTSTSVGIMLEPFVQAPSEMPKMNAPGSF